MTQNKCSLTDKLNFDNQSSILVHVVLYNAFSGIPHPLTFMIHISRAASTRVDMLSHSTADTNDRFLQMFTKYGTNAYERNYTNEWRVDSRTPHVVWVILM